MVTVALANLGPLKPFPRLSYVGLLETELSVSLLLPSEVNLRGPLPILKKFLLVTCSVHSDSYSAFH